ncbi:MAG TPA: TonB-dependent receptor [Pyrinomonadaceae bacterium]|nr:TonB-dependent receptor [Pyrinomonadaceae bacterium]
MNRAISGLVRVMICGLFLLCAVDLANAQFKAGVQGTVTDEAGGLIPDAKVTLTNTENSSSQETTTSSEGFYRFSGLAPGKYMLTTEKAGYKKSVLEKVTIGAESTQGVDVQLQTGDITASVTVTDESASEVQTENANISGAITAQEIQRLPQIGRDPYSLIRTAPGVLGDTARGGPGNRATFLPGTEEVGGGSNTGVFQTENQVQISANGQRVSSNNYMVDGVSVNSLGLGGAAVVTPNQESVKEVSVVASSYSAEDGRNTGAQVKVVSQNGTNDFHGSAVFNYGSPKLNAFNKYRGPTTIPSTNLICQGKAFTASRCPEKVDIWERKFAGSLGGPIYLPRFGEGGPSYISGKNKLFFFVSYEGLRRSSTTFQDLFIETPEFRQYVQAVRPNSLAARLYSTAGIEPRVVTQGLTPSGPPNGIPINGLAGLSYDIGSINRAQGLKIGATQTFDGIPDVTFARVAFPNSTKGNQYNGRIDYHRGDNQFAVSTYITKLSDFSASRSGRPFQDILFEPVNTAATATWIRTISPTLLNEARFNFTRFHDDEVKSLGGANLVIPALNTNGFNFTGGPGLGLPGGGGLNYGIDSALPKVLTQNTFEVRDTLTWVRGNHAYKIGGEARKEQDNSNRRIRSRPEFSFDNILSLANDAPFFENTQDIDPLTGAPPDSQRYLRTSSYGLFLQDDWKFRPNVTINLGLRWEYQSPLTETQGRLTNYEFGPNGVIDGRVVPVDKLYDSDLNNFGPRLGIAWSPRFGDGMLKNVFGEDKLVVRAGFGIFYDRHFTNLFNNARFNTPFSAAGVGLCCGTPTDPDGTGQILYAFGSPSNPLSYPANPALRGGIDPVTGGLLLPGGPVTLPGGFIRRDIPIEINGAPRDLPNGYIYSYSLDFQYELPWKITTSVGYQGSMGRKLVRTIDLNRYYPGDSFNCVGCVNQKDQVQEALANGTRITPRLTGNPNFDRIFFPLPDVNSSYNAMILRATRRYSSGFQMEGIYRWAKSIDTSSFGRGAQQTDPSDQRLNRGPSDFDIRHNFILSGLWEIPLFRNRTDFIGKAFGGFQINGILDLHSGFPWTPQQGCCFFDRPQDAANDANGDGKGNDFPTQYFGGAIQNPTNQDFINGLFPNGGRNAFGVIEDCSDFPIHCVTTRLRGPAGVGRNSFRGPNYRSIDLSVSKRTGLPSFLHLGEAANLEVRANFFNVFNILNLPPFQTGGRSNTDFTNTGDFGRALSALAGRVTEFQFRFSF